MRTIETAQEAGTDGKLRLEIPVAKAGHVYHVVVIVDEQTAQTHNPDAWPPGYIESTIGKWEGDFVCESEGPFERRAPL